MLDLPNQMLSSNKGDLHIDYSENSRKIVLNDIFLLAKPDFNSENEVVFSYLFKKPGTKVSKSCLEKSTGIKLKKPFHQIVDDLGFTASLKRAFFSISRNTIKFNNPVKRELLADLKISHIRVKAVG